MPRIYTKTGDDGTTGLLYGGRIPKDDRRARAYGASDEAVAALGMARAASGDPSTGELLLRIQRDLFVLGAEIAVAQEHWGKLTPGETRVTGDMVDALEALIDDYVVDTKMPKEFIVPGEEPGSAAIDFARTVVRRCEREVTTLSRQGLLPDGEPLRYLNRLSDLLFVLARYEEGGYTPLHPREA